MINELNIDIFFNFFRFSQSNESKDDDKINDTKIKGLFKVFEKNSI